MTTPVLIVPSGKAIPVRYTATAPVNVVNASAPLALSRVHHHGAIVNLRPGASLSIARADWPPGSMAIVVNLTGADVAPTITGFAQAGLQNALNLTRIAKGGCATLFSNSQDGGVTAVVRAAGELV